MALMGEEIHFDNNKRLVLKRNLSLVVYYMKYCTLSIPMSTLKFQHLTYDISPEVWHRRLGPQQNGVAEQMNHTIMEGTGSMLYHAKLPLEF